MDSFGLLNQLLETFDAALLVWVPRLQAAGLGLFLKLAALELIVVGLWSIPRALQGGIELIFFPLARTFLYLCFVGFCLTHGVDFFATVLTSFETAGATAGNIQNLNPSGFLAEGVVTAFHLFQEANALQLLLDPFARGIVVISMVGVVISTVIMAIVITLTLIEARIVMGASLFFVGFAGCRWTAGIANGTITTLVRAGVRVMLLFLLASVIKQLVHVWGAELRGQSFPDPAAYWVFIGTCCVCAALFWRVPRMADSFVPQLTVFRTSDS